MTQRGDENSFQLLSKALQDLNNKFHVAKEIKHYQYAAGVDRLFENCPYGWGKSEFYTEANQRVGTNRPTQQTSDAPKKKKSAKKSIDG